MVASYPQVMQQLLQGNSEKARYSQVTVIHSHGLKQIVAITRARPLTLSGRFIRSCALDSFQPGTGPVDPTSLSAPHSAPRPLADTMALGPHECLIL
jgi:hypothetical protein